MEKRKIIDRWVKYLFLSLALVSTLAIFLIFIFLFKETAGLWSANHLDFGTKCILNIKNPVEKFSADDLFDIFNSDRGNWHEFGWMDSPIRYVDDDVMEDSDTSVVQAVSNDPLALGIAYESDLENIDLKKIGIKIVPVQKVGIISFITGKRWKPTATPTNLFGALPLILGTLWVTFSAILFAIPISLACAIYLSEIASRKTKEILKPIIEILAGIPSVVFGFFGLVVIVPWVKTTFNLDTGETALSSAIMLAVMCLPTITSISEDALNAVPKSLREASLSLGASKWQMIYQVVVPAAKSGIVAAVMLGVGRTVGETMTVLMISGNSAIIPSSILMPVRTLTGTIAAELGEAPQHGNHYYALFGIASILFIITFFINLIADLVIHRKKR